MCDRWMNSFEAFLADMGLRPEGKTLDRYPDPHGNYEPGNCRWATQSEQMNNTRRVRLTPKRMKAEPIRNPTCFECGKEFDYVSKTGRVPRFCTTIHQQSWQRRQAAQGRTVIALAKAWIASLDGKDAALTAQLVSELRIVIDPLNRGDRDAGRVDPIEYARYLLSSGLNVSSRKK